MVFMKRFLHFIGNVSVMILALIKGSFTFLLLLLYFFFLSFWPWFVGATSFNERLANKANWSAGKMNNFSQNHWNRFKNCASEAVQQIHNPKILFLYLPNWLNHTRHMLTAIFAKQMRIPVDLLPFNLFRIRADICASQIVHYLNYCAIYKTQMTFYSG